MIECIDCVRGCGNDGNIISVYFGNSDYNENDEG